ncbi:MAG TPA: DUF2505 domain-containing protein [Nocardioidaceae bacterium]
MKFRHRLTYAAPPSEIYQMRADPAFRSRVCEAMGTLSHDVTVDDSDGALTVVVDMVQQTRGVPGFAKKVVGDQTRVIQTERWGDTHTGDIDVEIPGKPGRVRGTLSISADGDGSVYAFDGEATVNIPLVGGKLEGVFRDLFVKGMDTEQSVGAAWLRGED